MPIDGAIGDDVLWMNGLRWLSMMSHQGFFDAYELYDYRRYGEWHGYRFGRKSVAQNAP